MPSAAKTKRAAAKKLAGRGGGGKHEAETAAAAAAAPAAADDHSTEQRGGQPDTQPLPDVQLLFPPTLTARQRAALHAVGEKHGLAHASSGEGTARRLALGRPGATTTVDLLSRQGGAAAAAADSGDGTDASVAAAAAAADGEAAAAPAAAPSPTDGGGSSCSSDGQFTDEQLVSLLKQHLHLDAADAFLFEGGSSGGDGGASARPPAAWRAKGGGKAAAPGAAGLVTVEAFIARMLPLLEQEREAEVAQAEETLAAGSPESAAAKGRALLNLRLTEAEGGLLGRTLLTLVNNKGGGGAPLPPHKMSPHDIVRLRPSKGDAAGAPLAEGVVYRVRDAAIVIAVDDVPDDGLDVPLRLEKMANEVTYKRLRAALQTLGGDGQRGMAAPMVDVLFGRRSPGFSAAPPAWQPLNGGLDESQQRAVSLALAAQDVALIHGPPGTGKTTAVVELICQEAARGSRVLACAASNVAVDNLVERLALATGGRVPLVRVGHPARLLPQVLENSLEAKVLQSDNSALAKDCRREMKALNTRLIKLVNRKDRDERRAVRGELRQLAKEERQRQQKAVDEVLRGAQIVCATLTGVGARNLERLAFDVIVIDEAAQALEPACWAALLKGRKAVLAGDHLQLPPTILSEAAAKAGLSRTLFERLQDLWGAAASEMLTVQYRMNSAIMDWSSQELYGGRLSAAPSVAGHTVAELAGAGAEAAELPVLLLIDTAGCDMEEQAEAEGDSKWNDGEAAVVMRHVQRLMGAGIAPDAIGVITPYSAQVSRLRELRPEGLAARLEISTVDGFQGREKEAIVISMVRSNAARQVGFLADARRMNVAVTRARRHCALVADSETVASDPFLRRLVAYFEEHGEYASAEAS